MPLASQLLNVVQENVDPSSQNLRIQLCREGETITQGVDDCHTLQVVGSGEGKELRGLGTGGDEVRDASADLRRKYVKQ